MTAAPARAPETSALLEARALSKHFPVHRAGRAARTRLSRRRGQAGGPAVHAVEAVSLALPAGGITAVVGESGSGKSTLARLLARLITPTSGQLLLDGQDLPASGRAKGRREYARDVQLVLQDPFSSLNPVHDVRYHLARPLRIHGFSGLGASLDEAMTGLLERVALTPADQFLGKYPHELSGGQRQRVAIARALAVRPRVLLADEPVSMLDVSIRLGVLNLLADLRERDGLAILYITHDIASARYLADTIIVMYAGQVVESAPAGQVTDGPAHPYTQLLLSAAPDPDRAEPPSLAGRGAPPSLVTPPSGCRFHPRCPHAMAVCAEQAPPAFEVAAGHQSSCWLHAADLTAAQARQLSEAAGGPAGPAAAATGVTDPGKGDAMARETP
ncbi:MAG TPA: ABC transporter ATP-binding protein [Streptosporangiaceae bacterium]|nr:ABC transporter ATP-binding protein [Streptosporangiaceae bacterium]